MKEITVVAAIIQAPDTRILATQRGYGAFKDYWEFPGGKVEAGENHEDALRREIREELATDIIVVRPYHSLTHTYEDKALTVHLHFFLCHLPADSQPTLLEHESARWLSRTQLPDVGWLPADFALIRQLQEDDTLFVETSIP